MARGNPYRFQRFARGLNTADGVFNLRDGYADDPTGLGAEARDLLNVTSRSRGNVGKRNGCSTVKARTGIKDFSPVDANTAGLAIYSTDGGALYSIDEASTETSLVASGLSATAPWTFLRLPAIGGQGPYYGMDGTDTPRQVTAALAVANWTATTGAVPNGTMMVYVGNRLWVSGVAADPYAVYWSEVGDPRNWPAANVTRFAPEDGKPITGLGVVGNYVLVFKETDIWRIYDLDTSANVRLGDNAGTLSPRAIVSTEQGCFFLDPARGVLVTDGQTVREVSRQILPTLQRISVTDAANVTAAYWMGHLYLAARLDGTTRYLFDYHIELDSWWLHTTTARALGTWDRGTGRHLFAAHTDTLARLFVSGVWADEGVKFRSYWSGPFHDFNSSTQKRCAELRLDGAGLVDVYVLPDFYAAQGILEGVIPLTGTDTATFGGSGSFGVDGTFGAGVTIGQDSIYSLGLGRVWSVTVGDALDQGWEMDAYTMWMTSRKD